MCLYGHCICKARTLSKLAIVSESALRIVLHETFNRGRKWYASVVYQFWNMWWIGHMVLLEFMDSINQYTMQINLKSNNNAFLIYLTWITDANSWHRCYEEIRVYCINDSVVSACTCFENLIGILTYLLFPSLSHSYTCTNFNKRSV